MGPLRGSGVRALRRNSRATKTEPRIRGGRTEIRKEIGERLERLWTQRPRLPFQRLFSEEIRMRRGMRMNLGHVGGERGRDNRSQGRGRKPRETPGNKGGETRGEASIET